MYKSVKEMAKLWGISERSVRNYCSLGKIDGAILIGKIWNIPDDASNPTIKENKNYLLDALKKEMKERIKGRIYHRLQIDMTYNSNHMEGSTLTHDETRYIFETKTLLANNKVININDIIETTNHFYCIDYVIAKATSLLSEQFIKNLHAILKTGTSDSKLNYFKVGGYKTLENEVGGRKTTPVKDVEKEINKLIKEYNKKDTHTLTDILNFHVSFERIHPFQDGNGRVGRLIILKECLKNNIVPFIIKDSLKMFYYRGLKEWDNEQGYLIDTCLSAQDEFKESLDYFKIKYKK